MWKKVKTLYTVSAALCKKWQSKESNIFKTFFKKNILMDLWYCIEVAPCLQDGVWPIAEGPVPLELLPAAKAWDGIRCYGFLIKIIKFLLITPVGLTVVTAVPSSAWGWLEFHKRLCQGDPQTWLYPEGSPRRSPKQGSFGEFIIVVKTYEFKER